MIIAPERQEMATKKKDLAAMLERLWEGLPNDERHEFRAPKVLIDLVEQVAPRRGVSVAAYIRIALLRQIEDDLGVKQ